MGARISILTGSVLTEVGGISLGIWNRDLHPAEEDPTHPPQGTNPVAQLVSQTVFPLMIKITDENAFRRSHLDRLFNTFDGKLWRS
jgi:hypothetical protein